MSEMKIQNRLQNMKTSIGLYYDFIVEMFPLEGELVYDREKFKELFATEKEFDRLDDLFWFIVKDYIHKDDLEKVDIFRKADIERRIARNEFWMETEFRLQLKQGTYRWISAVTILLFDDEMRNTYVLMLFKDIHKKKLLELESTVLARRDAMTRLYNKTYTESMVKKEIEKLNEHSKSAFIIIDIDDFKNVNDTYGHMIGDHVIIEFASRLMACTRETDIVGRVGGDEFLVFVPEFSEQERLVQKIEKMQESLRYDYCEKDIELNVHCSMGVAVYGEKANTYNKLFQTADKALYKSKRAGKDQVHIAQ